MNENSKQSSQPRSRRAFLKQSGSALSAGALLSAFPSGVHAAEQHTIKVALVGCGGRGTGAAANALSTQGPTKLWATADIFAERTANSLKNLAGNKSKQLDASPDRQFLGFDAYKKAIDTLDKNDVVILATPPAFRPLHFEYAVQKGVNVFMEKSFGVDAPGVRRVIRSSKLATQKNLKVAGGLMWHHDTARKELVKRIHDGAIGDIHTLRTYRMHGPVGFRPKGDAKELAHQIRNYSNFTWVNGSFFVDWIIHNIDVCCWVKQAWPVAAQGQGGRQVRTASDQMWDHYAVEYTFADGSRMFAQGRHMDGCWGTFGDYAHGSRGSAVIMERLGAPRPRYYKNQDQIPANEVWRFKGRAPNPYQVEHDLLFEAIRENKPYNEGERSAHAALASILGRMAAFSGKRVTWDEAMASNLELSPGLDDMSWESTPPVLPGKDGQYPIAKPGVTKARFPSTTSARRYSGESRMCPPFA